MAYACPPRNTSCKMSQSISQSNKKQHQQQLFVSLLTYANAITAGTVTGRTTSSGNGLGNFTRKQENGTDELRISIYQGDNKCDYWKDFWLQKKPFVFVFSKSVKFEQTQVSSHLTGRYHCVQIFLQKVHKASTFQQHLD